MENASKALLIAGAVLIVILLIGIGMLIYSRSTGVIDTAASTMNSQEIQSFNSQFTPYEGTQKGPSVRALLSTVIANNGTYAGGDKVVNIDAAGLNIDGVTESTNDASTISTISSQLNTATSYVITMSGFSNGGLINEITIAKPSTPAE